MKNFFIVFLVILFLSLGGAAAFLFNSPDETGEKIDLSFPEINEPDVSRAFVPPPQPASSWVTVPIDMSREDLESLANRKLMRTYNGRNEYLEGAVNGKLDYRVEREGDVKLVAENGELQITVPVKFKVKFVGSALLTVVRVPFSVETDGALDITLSIKPSVRRDWSIKTDAKVEFNWKKSPTLNVVGIKIGLQREASKFFSDMARDYLPKLEDELNSAVKLREIVQREWDNLSVPFKIAENFLLIIDPRSVSALPLEISDKKISLRVCVEAGLSVVMTSAEVPGARKKNLPPLGDTLPKTDSINISSNALLTFEALTKEATKAVAPLKIDLGLAEVSVKSVVLKGDGERILGLVDVAAGFLSGKIYVVGKPVFDEKTRTISVTNFDLEPATRETLAQKAAWLLKPALVNSIKEKLKWEVGPQIDSLLKNAGEAIEKRNLSDEIELSGKIDGAKFKDLRVTENGLELALDLTGKASLTYKPR